jgi:hypothetical protein
MMTTFRLAGSYRVWPWLRPVLLAAGSLLVSAAQAFDSPVKDGPVYVAWYAHVEDGRWWDYMKFLDRVYRVELEALRSKGLIVGYQIVRSEARSHDDWNLAIILEYGNMAALDVPPEELESTELEASRAIPGIKELERDRDNIRKVIGIRTYREIRFIAEAPVSSAAGSGPKRP